jgi:hypothetical protein
MRLVIEARVESAAAATQQEPVRLAAIERVAAALFAATGISLSTALYLAGVWLVSFIAMAFGPETFRASLHVKPSAQIVASAN